MRLAVACCLLPGLLLGAARATPASPAGGPPTVETRAAETKAGVRAVLDAQVEAWNKGDLEAFMAGYWRSPELVFCSGATVTKGWDATLARYRKRYQSEGREMGTLRFEGIEVLPMGAEAAAARGAYRLKMSDGKEPHGLFTLLLRREAGAWRIIHDHTSSAE